MFLTAVLFLAIETFAELLQPAFMARIVDRGVSSGNLRQILHYGITMLSIACMGAAGAVIRNIFASRTSQIISKEIRSDLYRKVQTLSFENIDRLEPSSIITRITNDVTQIQNFVNGIMRIMMKVPIICIGSVTLIIIQTPRQFPIMAGILFVSALLITANMKYGYPRFHILQEKLDRLNNVSREFLSSIRVVKAFNAESQEYLKFLSAAEGFSDAGISASRVLAVFSPLINLTVNMGIILLLWISQAQNASEIGRLMASINYMTQVLFALNMISNILNSAVRAAASAERIQEILNEVPAQKLPSDPEQIQICGTISFQDVSFAYANTSRAAIDHITFTAHAGETIGIIGPTGSGKTSLINLVPRFYDATSGKILIDRTDIRKFNPETLRSAIAIVSQKPLLFTGTIAENLRWGNPEATDTELKQAAQTACADNFIDAFPKQFNTWLGQGGVNLSGGQKQRLSIARALLRNPRILILDDCTSALDASTEASILNSLHLDCTERTVLLISQRISTVMRADRILCLEDGKICGLGTHQELLAACKPYQEIYRSQIGGDSYA